jgi:hypothetical protein
MGRTYLRNELHEDIRVKRLARTLALPVLHVCGALWRLWSYADDHADLNQPGLLAAWKRDDVDELVSLPGFSVALEAVEPLPWLEVSDAGVVIPRFGEHCGVSAKRRIADRDRKRSVRADTSRTRRGRRADGVRTRRGNVADGADNVRVSAPASASASASASAVREALAQRIQGDERLGPGIPDPRLLVHQLAESFPGLDFGQALDDAIAHLDAGNEMQTTADRFLRSWVARDRDRYCGRKPPKAAVTAGEQSMRNVEQAARELGVAR